MTTATNDRWQDVISGSARWAVVHSEAMDLARQIPDRSLSCVITSPPYWGLRDYGIGDVQIGLERTPEEYVARLVALFAELRRALRDDGTLWLNIGDSYVGNASLGGEAMRTSGKPNAREPISVTKRGEGLKPKDLVGIPWMLAFGLRADGWYLRSDIIWHKPTCMPESVRDRPTRAHEHLFLLAKSERYYYDIDAIKERSETAPRERTRIGGGQDNAVGTKGCAGGTEYRNRRNVWTIASEPLDEAHYAAWPTALVTPCILAGCPVDGIVYDPFTGGSGRLPGECIRLGRRFIGSEASAKYATMTRERVVYGHGKTGGEARIEPKGVLL